MFSDWASERSGPLGASWSLLGPLGASWSLLGPLGSLGAEIPQTASGSLPDRPTALQDGQAEPGTARTVAWTSSGPPGPVLGRPGRLWAALAGSEPLWPARPRKARTAARIGSGPSWGRFGPVLGPSWAVLGRLGAVWAAVFRTHNVPETMGLLW